MAGPIPPSLRRCCRRILPQLLAATRGRRMLGLAAEVLETDRWNSFDRFHQTTRTLVHRYEAAGARAEVHALQTGGRIGTGRWIIQEAEDVRAATVEVVAPVRRPVLDYQRNPWHVIQWTAATPRAGMVNTLTIVDSKEELERLSADGLLGRMVLTRLDPRALMRLLADKGAAGVITDRPVAKLPGALAWTKFGWGGVPLENAAARLVGLVLSEEQGHKLRRLAQERGPLTLRTRVEARKYVGAHDVVSGVVRGAEDPQDEVWVLAHSAEPGAIDNASGVAVCLEIARVLEELIGQGRLPRPRRSVRMINAYECYGFFGFMEKTRRLQPPLAGVCIDTLGAKPAVCDGRLEWHATIPMAAGFVDQAGEAILRSALRRHRPGYRLCLEPFVSTADTLAGDPQYGFPCPWITTHHRRDGKGFDAYHSSADTLDLLSPRGLETCAAAMAGYLYYLAQAGSPEVVELATAETQRVLETLAGPPEPLAAGKVEVLRASHHASLVRLQRWLWGGDRRQVLRHLADCERQVRQAATGAVGPARRRRVPPAGRQVPRRSAFLSPTLENVAPPVAARLRATGLKDWALFWADGARDLAQIARAIAGEQTGAVGGGAAQPAAIEVQQVIDFFEAQAELGYAHLVRPEGMIGRERLVADLRKLGVRPGMDLMVHSSLSGIGHVRGGADTVVQALLEAIGRRGTLLMPSFNHRSAQVYNPLTTPTTNGAIPEAMWRRPEAQRSLHPTHAVAAIGPRAGEYCRDHLEVGVWAQDSPIGKLVHGGGYLLALGTTHETSTAYHVAEMSVPCRCNDPFGMVDKVVMPDGQVREVRGLAFRAGPCPVPISRLEASLDRRGRQRRGKVGNADCILVKALDLWRVRREQLRSVCPDCPVRPAYRKP